MKAFCRGMENYFVWLEINVQIVIEAAGRFWSLRLSVFSFPVSLSFILSQLNISMFIPQTYLEQHAISRLAAVSHSLSDYHLLSFQLTYSSALTSVIPQHH